MADILTEIVPLHTATATEASNPFVVLPGGAAAGEAFSGRYFVRIQYFNAQQASGSGVWTLSALISYNGGATFVSNVAGAALTLSTTSQFGEQVLQINPNLPTDSGRYLVMVIATLSGAPVTPQLAYRADLLTV